MRKKLVLNSEMTCEVVHSLLGDIFSSKDLS